MSSRDRGCRPKAIPRVLRSGKQGRRQRTAESEQNSLQTLQAQAVYDQEAPREVCFNRKKIVNECCKPVKYICSFHCLDRMPSKNFSPITPITHP